MADIRTFMDKVNQADSSKPEEKIEKSEVKKTNYGPKTSNGTSGTSGSRGTNPKQVEEGRYGFLKNLKR